MVHYPVIVVGGGMAGLTAAAYIARANQPVLLIEKEPEVGGLVGNFVAKGFTFDKGARSIENSGILFPMLKDLNITIDWIKSPITLTFGQDSLQLNHYQDITHYHNLLLKLFPAEKGAIDSIMKDIYQIMTYMDVLYGIDNPLFMKMPPSMTYLTKELMPWLFRLLPNLRKAMKFMNPVEEHLKKYTSNQVLIDLIAQHFFEKTPTFFALSYFTIYLDYFYPKGGTGVLPERVKEYLVNHHGTLALNKEIKSINIETKTLVDKNGQSYTYDELIWTADTKLLYRLCEASSLTSKRLRKMIQDKQTDYQDKKGADSILTLYVGVDIPSSTFAQFVGPHAFITPSLQGQSTHRIEAIKESNGQFIHDKLALKKWIESYLEVTTFELAIPALRDPSLAPINQTGLIISVLFDYQLAKHIQRLGWYDELKVLVQQKILAIFQRQWSLDLASKLVVSTVSTPLTIERYTNSSEGSVSGWSFANQPFPAQYQFMKVSQSVKTPLPHVSQAGQWTFNPAGIPIAIMTGKLAADAVLKKLK